MRMKVILILFSFYNILRCSSPTQRSYIKFGQSLSYDGKNTWLQDVPSIRTSSLSAYEESFDPTNVDNIAQVLNLRVNLTISRRHKKVIGIDERKLVDDTSLFPWSAIGRLRISGCSDSEHHTCSGVMIAPSLLLTAAHCVRRQQEWCKSAWFTTGQSFGEGLLKFDGGVPIQIDVPTCWDAGDLDCDFALLHLDWQLGCATGFFGFGYDCDNTIYNNIKVAGFPKDDKLSTNKMYYSECDEVLVGDCMNEERFIHDCDTSIGMSGSPLWRENTRNNQLDYIVFGINRGAKVWTPENVATKISIAGFQWIKFMLGEREMCLVP
eukprot:TRINITY_DN3038_c0_g1_i4.p1 TRINITY_DN3038_c0_g1~~TRINITY_DN3038_c0_g1_i4.p1  ORF type:complete len:323 (-),score=29.92 TRINITY_DN3038_c0_g1_i4:65-1033(-)